MTLPFKIGEPVEKEKNVNYEEIPVEGLRALLAEDNELNMEITKFMLEDYGIHVECAADGEEAVQKFKNTSGILRCDLHGHYDAEAKWLGCHPQDPVHETVGCRKCPHHCHERQCLCGRHYQQPMDEKKLLETVKECIMSGTIPEETA